MKFTTTWCKCFDLTFKLRLWKLPYFDNVRKFYVCEDRVHVSPSLHSYRIKIMKKSPQHFGRLVLVCIDSYDSEKRRILQYFSRSTRFAVLCTAQISKFQQKLREHFWHFFSKISTKFSKFCHLKISAKFNFWWNLPRISRNVQKFSEKTEKMSICRKKSKLSELSLCWYFRNCGKSSFVHIIGSITSLVISTAHIYSPFSVFLSHLSPSSLLAVKPRPSSSPAAARAVT